MTEQKPAGQGTSGLAPNVASLLCYLCTIITGIIFLVIEKENKDVRFHAWQALILGIASIVLQVAFGILGVMAGFLGGLIAILSPLVWLGFLIIWIIAMIKAYQGERYKIPVIGDMAEKQVG